ncbi:MAG: S49 family peptidase [Solirubrobacteraceae bacterium]|nr:S49 family peptidase [Solirubrobacteraceae bacterium]
MGDDADETAQAPGLARHDLAAPWAVMPELLPEVGRAIRATARIGSDATTELTAAAHAIGRGQMERRTGAVAVISIRGFITPRPSLMSLLCGGGGGLEELQAQIRGATTDDAIDAIVLDIDSPGGSVSLVPETAAAIRDARAAKPVIAVANTLAASAAYWLAAQADEVIVSPSGQVGSIGVLLEHADWSTYEANLGVRTTLISAGRYKTEANPLEPLGDEARAALQSTVDAFYDLFVTDVAQGRNVTADHVRDGMGEGRVLPASRAVDAGLADRVGTLEQTVARVARGDATAAAPDATVPARTATAPHPTVDASHILAALTGRR